MYFGMLFLGMVVSGLNFIPWLIGALIIILFVIAALRLWRNSQRVLTEIRLAKAELVKYDRNAAATQFSEIDSWFRQNTDLLLHPWLEFHESCVKLKTETGAVRVFNTIDSAHFFHADDLVDGVLETEVTRHAPGVFTAMGIVGTFLGIWLGLDRARAQLGAPSAGTPGASGAAAVGAEAADKVTQATQELLNHVGPAFGASFVAVLLAVIFLGIERIRVQKVRAELAELQNLLDKLFPRKTAEGVLVELLAESGKQSQSVQKLSTDFASQMEPVLQKIVELQAQKMDEANQALITNIAAAIHSRLEPLTDSLAKATKELGADQSRNATEAIESLVGKFSSTLTSGAENQVTQLSGTIQSLVSALEVQRTQMAEQQSQMEGFLGSVGSTSSEQAKLLEQQVQELVRQTRSQQDESTARLEALFERLATGLAERTGKISEDSTSALSQAGNNLSAMVEESVRAQQVAAGTLETTLKQMQEAMTTQTTFLIEEVARASQTSSASVIETQDRAAERIAHVMQATQQSIEENLQQLTQTLQTQSSHHQQEANRLLVSTLDSLRKATEDLVAQLRTETTGQLGLAVQAITQASEKNAAAVSAGTAGEMRRLTDGVEGTLSRLAARMDESVTISSQVNTALLKRFDEQATLLERLAKQTNQQVGSLTQDLEAAASRVGGLLEGLSKFADGMKAQIVAHREVTGQLLEVAQGLQGAAKSVQSQSATAQETTNRLATLGQKLETQNQAADERIRILRDLHQRMVELAAALSQGVARQQQAVSEMSQGFDRMKDSANNYFGSVVPNLQKALGEFDTQLTKGTDMLGAAVERMAEPCENIADILDDMQKRLVRR